MKINAKLMPLLVICLVLAFSLGAFAAEEELPFTDIDNHWSKDAVMEMYSYGIVNGYEDSTYRPDNTVTRAEFAAMLYRVLNTDITTVSAEDSKELPFQDVPQGHWAYDIIAELYQAGIINGVSETSFDPSSPIKREDMAKLIYEANEKSDALDLYVDDSRNIAKIDDVGEISKYAVDAFTLVYQAGVFNGDDQNCLNPKAFATRGETAQVFCNTFDSWTYDPLPTFIYQEEWVDNKQYVELSNGLTMAYVEMGNREGEPLVLIHGSSDTSRSWSMLAPYFSDYHIYIPEMRAHGATPTGGIQRIEQGLMAYDVVCFLDAMELDRVNIMGHSRGAAITQLVTLNYPERVSRAVFESARAVSTNTPADQRDETYYEDPFTSLPIDDEYMDWWYYNDAPVDEDFLAMAKYEASWLPLEAWRAIGGSLREPQDLEDIPAMVIYGEDDYLMDETVRDQFVEAYGDNVEYICHEGMGHNVHWEDPAMIAEEVLDFFNRTEPAEIAAPAEYPVGDKPEAPVAPTGAQPEEGKLPTSIAQGDWNNFKKYVELDSGITMAYIEMGNPDGEPLVLLHGMTDSSRSWSLLVPYLVDDYHLYIPDQRGHGDTDKPDMKKYDNSVFAWDIACFMDEVGLEKASVMGHSMGSFNAQAFAMDYPEKVDKLILESTRMIGTNSENPDDSYNIYDPDSPTFEGVTWDYIEWWYYNTNPVPEVFHQMAMHECYSYPLETWQVQFPVDYQARLLKNAGIEVLILYGGTDYLMDAASQEIVKQQMTEAGVDYQYITYTNRGHNLHWEESEQVADDVKAFLNGTLDPELTQHEYEPFNNASESAA